MSAGDDVQLVRFRVGGQDFALDVFQVERILRHQRPTPVPKAPPFLEGVVTYGNAPVPVVDLRKRLEVEAVVGDDTRLMLLDMPDGRVGVIVDAVLDVLTVPAERVAPPPQLVRGLAAAYVRGLVTLGERTLIVLAVANLLSSKERLALRRLIAETVHE